jgi:2,5-furandicarboxylate decarboxylase 1
VIIPGVPQSSGAFLAMRIVFAADTILLALAAGLLSSGYRVDEPAVLTAQVPPRQNSRRLLKISCHHFFSPMPKDLRSFLVELKASRPDDLVTVSAEVDPNQEAIALVRNLEARGLDPAVYFEKIRGSAVPVLVNVHASPSRLALALGTTAENLNSTYAKRLEKLIPPVLVTDAPVHENVLTGTEIDLSKWPLLTPFADCPAPYISGGIMVVKDCESGVRNLSYIRMMVTGRDTMTMNAAPFQHTDIVIRNAEKQGRTCPAAIIIGYHPAVALGSLAKVPFDVDEYDCCGALLQEALPLVKCRTIDLEVPADAEMVIEVEILPTELVFEGPYGEFTGYALPAEKQPVVRVRAITHRNQPIYQDVTAGAHEHLLLGKIPKESTQERYLKSLFPTVRKVHMPFSGRGRFHLVISVGPHRPADIRRLMLAAYVNDHFVKHVFVVDDDVDIQDDTAVLSAFATCFQADRDMVVLNQMPGSSLDPSGYPGATGSKLGFDCTRKGANFPPRFHMDTVVTAKMQPGDYLPAKLTP